MDSREIATQYPDRKPELSLTWTGPSPGASAPWVTFRDETSTRLVLTTVSTTDGEEKDMAVGDFDRDGDDDVVIVRKLPFSTNGQKDPLLLLNEGGILTDATAARLGDVAGPRLARNARDVFAGDLDRDGAPDLAIANTCNEAPTFYRNKGGRCTAWSGFTRQDSWLPPASGAGSFSTTGKRFCGVAGGDVDNDGDVDLYLSNYQTECDGMSTGTVASDVLLVNQIDPVANAGNFVDPTVARFGGTIPVNFGTAAEILDFDNDTTAGNPGDNDIARVTTPLVELFRNTGNTGDMATSYRFPGSSPDRVRADLVVDNGMPAGAYMFASGRLNADSLLDFYIVADGQDRVQMATGPMSYKRLVVVNSPRTGNFGGNAKMADIDGDGDLDVGVADVDVNAPGCPSGRVFALLRNIASQNTCGPTAQGMRCAVTGEACVDNTDCSPLHDPWPLTNPQALFHTSVFDFAFLDVNRDGCKDLLLGLCTGYRVLINTTPPCQGG